MQVSHGNYLLHRYWGRALREYRDAAALQMIDRSSNSPQPSALRAERSFSLDVLPQEYPESDHGDFRIPAYQVELADGTRVTELWYKGYHISQGKPALAGLPATYAKASEAETLAIELADTAGRLQAVLSYTVFADVPVLARSVRFENIGKEPVKLLQAASMALDFPDHAFDRISLDGAWAHERQITRAPLQPGIQVTSSARGTSSHQHSPFLALARTDATEAAGDVYGCSLVYSGSFAMETEVEQFGTTRVVAGINPQGFSWQLAPGEAFQTPEAVMVYTPAGFTGMSQAYHSLYRQHLLRGRYQQQLRPILVNNWEATYFDFDEPKIAALADSAKELGLELLVLDDGWFGHRNDDNTSLGDWTVNRKKLPHGIEGVARMVHERGLKFGLWFEPEMVSVDSCLYREHPDWTLHVADYPSTFGRNQLVLDLSRPEVREHVYQSVASILQKVPVDYVKWDMNRHLTEAFSAGRAPEHQGETRHRYVLGLYEVLERITHDFPEVLFESCSSGGGRFDAGMLYYMPQTWTSDDTDAICRLKIQYGTSLAFPAITMGAHVSVIPNHQVGRMTPLATRGIIAMSGNFGYELDIGRMSAADQAEVKRQVALYKRIRPTTQLGRLYRLLSPFAGNEAAWMFVAPDGGEAVVIYVKTLAQPASPLRILHLAGLDAAARYRIADYYGPVGTAYENAGLSKGMLQGQSFYGDELMYSGMAVEKIDTDFAAYLWVLEKE
jgi:alpha-galactosidase